MRRCEQLSEIVTRSWRVGRSISRPRLPVISGHLRAGCVVMSHGEPLPSPKTERFTVKQSGCAACSSAARSTGGRPQGQKQCGGCIRVPHFALGTLAQPNLQKSPLLSLGISGGPTRPVDERWSWRSDRGRPQNWMKNTYRVLMIAGARFGVESAAWVSNRHLLYLAQGSCLTTVWQVVTSILVE
ncbi:hypothetical protein BD289DRAFT_49314 [Coniella lustricola]|uniref:Uncharacterized protein n=1 Tax=Coniella lustricola TaxID=2025994 RepID=A0A2T3AIK5_9PEZI|nr:hypothetical protein BD289DRAFT_49314 [Coniella lustricola]